MHYNTICYTLSHTLFISTLGSKDVYTEVFNLFAQPRFDLDRKYVNNDLQFKFASKYVQANLWVFFIESLKAII